MVANTTTYVALRAIPSSSGRSVALVASGRLRPPLRIGPHRRQHDQSAQVPRRADENALADDGVVYVVTQRVPGIAQPSSIAAIDVQHPTVPRIDDVTYAFERHSPLEITVADGRLH